MIRRHTFCRGLIAIGLLLSQATAVFADGGSLSRGMRWVRSHPLTIFGLCLYDNAPLDTDLFHQAGFSAVMVWKVKKPVIEPTVAAGLPWHVHLEVGVKGRGPFNDESKAMMRRLMTDYPGAIGWLINDEVKGEEPLRITREVLAWLRSEYPEMLIHSNANDLRPGGRERAFLRNWEQTLKPDVLMVTLYPYTKDGGTNGEFFFNLETIREVGLQAGIPYFSWIQSFGARVGYPERLPSESDLRMQLFASLTYGFTGFGYFIYEVWDNPHIRRALLYNGKPTRLYVPAAKVNAQITRLGEVLRFLTSTSVGYIAAPGAELPIGTTAWQPAGWIEQITATRPDGQTGLDGLVGRFKDDDGGTYFMLTNLAHGPESSAQDEEAVFRLQIASDAPSLLRLNRETGQREEVLAAGGGELVVTLPGGTGDLFKWSDGHPWPAP